MKEQAEFLEQLTEQEYLTSFYEILKAYRSSTSDVISNDTETVTDIIDLIVQLNETDARKLKKYEKKLQAFGEEALAYAKEDLQGQSIAGFVIQEFYNGAKLPFADKDCDVYVSYLRANIMGVFFRGEKIEETKLTCYLGVIFSKNVSFRTLMSQRASITEEKALAMLKLLADKSKFQILSATVDTGLRFRAC